MGTTIHLKKETKAKLDYIGKKSESYDEIVDRIIAQYNDIDGIIHEIQNYNCDGMCCEEICSERYTHSTIIKIRGMNLVIAFCKEHAEEYNNKRI